MAVLMPIGPAIMIASNEIKIVIHSGNQTEALPLDMSKVSPKILQPYALNPGIEA
jgi:hypothetical protein